EASLSSTSAFKEAAKYRSRPGLFAYANTGALTRLLDDLAPKMPTFFKGLRTALNSQAFRYAVASMSLESGNVDGRIYLELDSAKSPLVDLIAQGKVKLEGLYGLPTDSLTSLTLSLGNGEKQFEELLALVDGIARNEGQAEEALPSKLLGQMEERVKL